MAKLGVCSKCGGFQPGPVCPHCGKRSTLVRALGGVLGGGAIAFTLMACYGMPPCPEGSPDCHGPKPSPAGDGGPSMPTAVDPPDTPVVK